MRIWARIWKDGHMVRDTVVEEWSDDTRTHKVFHLLEQAAREFDLAVPIWLESNIRDFKRSGLTRFTRDSFIEEVDFDALEFRVIEE